jgi:hypothetical protein
VFLNYGNNNGKCRSTNRWQPRVNRLWLHYSNTVALWIQLRCTRAKLVHLTRYLISDAVSSMDSASVLQASFRSTRVPCTILALRGQICHRKTTPVTLLLLLDKFLSCFIFTVRSIFVTGTEIEWGAEWRPRLICAKEIDEERGGAIQVQSQTYSTCFFKSHVSCC